MVENRAALDGRQHSGQQAQHDGEQHGRGRQLDRGRKQGDEFFPHAFACDQRFTEIALSQTADVIEILRRQGLVETQPVHGFGMHDRVHPALAHHHLDRIARNHADQPEGDQRDAEEGRDQQAEPLQNKRKHRNSL